jgi:Flp pilus assembly protein TadD
LVCSFHCGRVRRYSLFSSAAERHLVRVSGRIRAASNPSFVSTYAFSLYAKGDIKGAREAMDKLTPEQFRDGSLAAYYGVLLAASGQKEKSREYLRRANDLPEEKALIAKSESGLN